MKKILIFLTIIFICSGCIKMLLKKNGIIGGKPILKEIKLANKELLFLPMSHLSEQEFFDKSKKIIDSLHNNEGYFIFGESYSERETLSHQDTIRDKKIRKILDMESSREILKSWMSKYKLVVQPNSLYEPQYIVDISLTDILKEYEKLKGEVILDECDLKTKIRDKYECKGLGKENRNFFLDSISIKMRDEYIASQVKKSSHKKILLIYGRAHYKGIKKLLEDTK